MSDDLGDTLRSAIAVPTDTMITLDLPLLLTMLSQVPAVPEPTSGITDGIAIPSSSGAGSKRRV